MAQELSRNIDDELPPVSLSLEEIENRFPKEWVVLDDTEYTGAEVVSGRVVFHSTDKKLAWRRALELQPNRPAVFFTGGPSPDVEFAL